MNTRNLNVVVPGELVDRCKNHRREGMSMSDVVRDALELWDRSMTGDIVAEEKAKAEKAAAEKAEAAAKSAIDVEERRRGVFWRMAIGPRVKELQASHGGTYAENMRLVAIESPLADFVVPPDAKIEFEDV